MNKNKIYEFVTVYNVTYVGKFIGTENDKLIFEDVLEVELMPMQDPNSGQIQHVPQFKMVGFYTVDEKFKINKDLITLDGELLTNFIDIYSSHITQLNDLKRQQGSAIIQPNAGKIQTIQ